MEEKIDKLFEYFTSKILYNPEYKFSPHSREKVAIKNFAHFLEEKYGKFSIGPYWLFQYFTFQFNYWKDKKTRQGEGLAQIAWIIGNKALERWENKTNDYWYFCLVGLLNINQNIKLSEIKVLINDREELKNYIELVHSEEIEKKRYLNTDKGQVHCIQNTDLYNHKSEHCQNCKINPICKELLRINYPHISKVRGYEI